MKAAPEKTTRISAKGSVARAVNPKGHERKSRVLIQGREGEKETSTAARPTRGKREDAQSPR